MTEWANNVWNVIKICINCYQIISPWWWKHTLLMTETCHVGQYHGCQYPGSFYHQDISNQLAIRLYRINKIISFMRKDSVTSAISVLRDDRKYKYIWVRSRNCGCLVTWFCYQLIAKPGNKTATVPWPDPYVVDGKLPTQRASNEELWWSLHYPDWVLNKQSICQWF